MFLTGLCAASVRADVFYNKGVQLAAEIIANPAGFFFDFQQDMETTNPLGPGKWLGFNWHMCQFLILPIPDPTILNLSGKFRVHPEGSWLHGFPQIDVVGGYWNAGPLLKPLVEGDAVTQEDWEAQGKDADDLDTEIKEAKFKGIYTGLVMTTSVEPRTRLFWGWKFSKMTAELELNKDQDLLGTPVRSFKVGYTDHFIMAGLEHATGKNKLWVIQLSYGVGEKSIASKVSWYRKNFELGLNIYPEGVLVIHPVINWHINF